MYFTFLFAFDQWAESESIIIRIDRITAEIPMNAALDVIADVVTESPRDKPTINGEYEDLRSELSSRRIRTLRIAPHNMGPHKPVEIYIYIENEHPTAPPAPTSSATGEEHIKPKLCTVSVSNSIWRKRGAVGGPLCSAIEDIFVERHCYYGNGHERQYLISGPFDLLKEDSLNRPVRVTDIHYREQIPGIYEHNYLSGQLLRLVNNSDQLCKIEGVSCRRLAGSSHGALALHVNRYEPEILAQLTAHLKPILYES